MGVHQGKKLWVERKQHEKRQRFVKVRGGIIFKKCKALVLCLIVSDENWRVGYGYNLKDFNTILPKPHPRQLGAIEDF